MVFLPDTPLIHAAFVGTEKAGLVIMGLGHRAGEAEMVHLVRKSQARAIITHGCGVKQNRSSGRLGQLVVEVHILLEVRAGLS